MSANHPYSGSGRSSRSERRLRHAVEIALTLAIVLVGWYIYQQLRGGDVVDSSRRGEKPGIEPDVSRRLPPLDFTGRVRTVPGESRARPVAPVPGGTIPAGVDEIDQLVPPLEPGLEEVAAPGREFLREERMLYGVGIPPGEPIQVRSLLIRQQRTPLFHTVDGVTQSRTRGSWLALYLFYMTRPDWIDELEVVYHVQVHDSPRGGRPLLFTRTLTYRDLPRGVHVAAVYMHPSSFERYGGPAHVTAMVRHRGVEVGRVTQPPRHDRWWDIYEPVEGMLYRARETPFGLLETHEPDFGVWSR